MFDFLMLAQDGESTGNAVFTLIFYAVILGGIFYFLIIRPQRTRARRHQELIGSIGVGDEVTTAGGIYGTVETIDDETAVIRVEDGGSLRIARRAIATKVSTTSE